MHNNVNKLLKGVLWLIPAPLPYQAQPSSFSGSVKRLFEQRQRQSKADQQARSTNRRPAFIHQ
jgi:hypothetical protein